MTDNWVGKKVLVTGAGGFIGSHLVECLAGEGAIVRAFVRYNARNDPGLLSFLPEQLLQRVEIVSGDLCDFAAVSQAMQEIEVAFHLGALIAIPYSYRHPVQVVQTNVLGTLNVLLAAREQHVARLVHTSTSEVYGTAQYVPIDEYHPLQGQSPYSASKIGADKLAESFFCAYGLPVVTLRPFNTYGPRQSARAIIPTIITQALLQDTIHLGNLEAQRDFTYVTDTVAGFMRAGQADRIEGMTFNLGVGSTIAIGDLANMIFDLLDKPVEVELDSQRLRPEKSEVQRLLSNNQRAREILGWAPQVSLTDGLTQTIRWIAQHLDHYQPRVYQV